MGAGADPADEQLVLLAKDGKLDAFNSLVDRHQGAVFSLCMRLLGQREAAEDAAQETFLSAYRALARFQGGSFRSWLLRIAANESKDELRRRKRKDAATSVEALEERLDVPLEIPDASPGAEQAAERRDLGSALEVALRELPFEQRQAILLVDLYDFQYEEAARVAGASVGTIKSRIHRGRERLRAIINRRPELFGREERQ